MEGNGTCRELVKYIHCRNCPVYSAAGLQLLNRPLPPEYRRERAAHYAQTKETSQRTRLSVVLFRLAAEWLALPTLAFQEVAERRALHSLPHRRRSLALGLVNVRGELLICASAARLLGLEDQENLKSKNQHPRFGNAREPVGFGPETLDLRLAGRLLVTIWQGQRLAFPVDEVHGIQRIPQDELREPPATLARSAHTYTRGVFAWRERTVGLLDADTFFTALNRSLA